MAVTVSGLYVANHIDVYDATQLALNLVGANNKLALYPSTITPDFSAAAASAAYAAGVYSGTELTGTNWSAGGVAMASQTCTESPTGSMMYDAADISVATVTLTGAAFALIYDNSLTPKSGIVGVNLGGSYSPVAGTFQIVWAATGVFAIDLTP